MRALNFSDVLKGWAQLSALDPSNISTFEFSFSRDAANNRLALCWESEYWPELVRYATSAITTSGGVNRVTLDSTVGTVLNATADDERAGTRVRSVPWRLASDDTSSYIIVRDNTDPIFYRYRKARPHLRGSVFDSTASYVSGNQVYFTTTAGLGNFYDANTTTTGSPSAQPSEWDVVEIPYIFQHYLVRGMYADWLRFKQRYEAAVLEDRAAESVMKLEADKLYRQSGQVERLNMVTYH